MNYELPNTETIADLLEMIFGEDINVSDSSAVEFDDKHIATFLDPDDNLVAICACDKEFVAYSGAALSMIPADVANEMIGGGKLSDAVEANFYEVMNICSKLMMSDRSSHLRLKEVSQPGASNDAVAALESNGKKLGFGVDIPRYGKGALNFMIG